MRFLLIAFGTYIAVLAVVDAYSFHGRYRSAVWQEAGYQAKRVHTEVRHILYRIGI